MAAFVVAVVMAATLVTFLTPITGFIMMTVRTAVTVMPFKRTTIIVVTVTTVFVMLRTRLVFPTRSM